MTPAITRKFGIDMGHRLLRHESKCAFAHGHRYELELSVVGTSLDACGRVIDFGAVKELVGGWLDTVFDHAFVVERGDPMIAFLRTCSQRFVILDQSPTVENLAHVWFSGAEERLAPLGITVTHLRAYETPNCFVDYTRADWERGVVERAPVPPFQLPLTGGVKRAP